MVAMVALVALVHSGAEGIVLLDTLPPRVVRLRRVSFEAAAKASEIRNLAKFGGKKRKNRKKET